MKGTNTTAIEFSCHAPHAKAVFVAGTFNDWKTDAAPLHRESSSDNGDWDVSLLLPSGHHEFKFVVDGQWGCEPGCEHEFIGCPKCVANPFGTMNRVVDVP
jgi:5'-AMP-activated protein kinase regulatory beta subunit